MKKFYFSFLVAILSIGACKRFDIGQNPAYVGSRITARQHLNAALFAASWERKTTLKIEDSVFHFSHEFNGFFNDSIKVITPDGFGGYEKITVYCDEDYIRHKVEESLKRGCKLILQDEPDPWIWRHKLYFNVDVTIGMSRTTDTSFNYRYPLSNRQFD